MKRCGNKRERSAQTRKYMARVGNTRKEYSKQKRKKKNQQQQQQQQQQHSQLR